MSNLSIRTSEGLLTLLALRGIGPKIAAKLANRFETLEQVRDAAHRKGIPEVKGRAADAISESTSWTDAKQEARLILGKAEQTGARILTYFDQGYPELLARIPDRPPVLYVKGTLPSDIRNVACIGTRHPTGFGLEVTRRIVRVLVEHKWSIVSGLALGVDTAAHREALARSGRTVAILGNGLDTVYPRENEGLAEDILAAGGAVVSEQPFGEPARPGYLVDRDRLQSGCCVGTFVMQTDIRGGSMHTVRFTLLQQRLLFAPVPSTDLAMEPQASGVLALTEQTGAELAEVLNPAKDYKQLLRSAFATKAVAFPITSHEDYPVVLRMLEQAVRNHAQLVGHNPTITAVGRSDTKQPGYLF